MITFLIPPVDSPTSEPRGGVKYTLRMAEALGHMGYDVVVYEQSGRPPKWLRSDVTMTRGPVARGKGDVIVVPEDQNALLESMRGWPAKKVVYCQSQFFAARGIGIADGYSSFGVRDMICASRSVVDYAKRRHPQLARHYVPCGIDTGLFANLPDKQNRIAFHPNKRRMEVAYMRDMFRHVAPGYRDWQWVSIEQSSEAETAAIMGGSSVFLSLNRLDSFGLMPLEAMAAGCVVAGFLGLGAREYATSSNGFWAHDDDLDGCLDQIRSAMDLAQSPDLEEYRIATMDTVRRYDMERFRDMTRQAWTRILQGDPA